MARSTFTLHRWGTNPFQLYNLLLLLHVSVNQVLIGSAASFNTAQSLLDFPAQIALSICNLIGSVICAFGLHLRDAETGLWIELSGYISLIGSLGIYLVVAFTGMYPWPTVSFGLALAQAFVLASIHRAVQIIQYKWARRRRTVLEAELLRRRLEDGGPPP